MKLLLLAALTALATMAQVTHPALAVGPNAPAANSCQVLTAGDLYVRSEDPSNGPIEVLRCTQTGSLAFAWQPVSHVVVTTLPSTCVVGDLAFKSNASAGSNLYGCTAANTWTAQGGGGGGAGDVVGPSSAVDSNFAAFDTTTGKLIKDSTKKASDFAVVGASTTVNGQACALGSTCTVADATKLPTAGGAITGNLALSGTLTPTALSGAVNDYNPTGCATALALRVDGGAADRNITGLQCAVSAPSDGQIIQITNIGATNNLVIVNQSASSTAANRFLLPADTALPINTALVLRYDGASSRWRPWSRALSNSGVTPGTYDSVTVATDGRVTAGTNPATTVKTDQANTYSTGAQDFSAATSEILPTSTGYAPTAGGSVGYDSTQQKTVAGGAGSVSGSFPRVLYSSWANTANNMIGTDAGTYNTLTATNGCPAGTCASTAVNMAYTIPAGYFRSGKVLLVTYTMLFTTSASAPTLKISLTLGGAGAFLLNTGLAPPSSRTNNSMSLSFLLVGTADPGGAVVVDVAPWQAVGTTAGYNNQSGQPNTFATNGALAIGMGLQWSAATAANMAQIRSLTVMEMN